MIRKHLSFFVSEREHAELKRGAELLKVTPTELIRRSMRAYLVANINYYYVRTSPDSFIPSPTEPGFSIFEEARRVAVQHKGEVVQRRWMPTGV